MVRKKLAVAVAAIGALQANLASALGMGEFDLQSALNQPLSAEIKLTNTRDLDPSQVKISLASREDFERAGVSRDYFLTNLKFSVELNNRGSGIIKIRSRDPVVEPYLNFLVEARWPTGRLLREYTVLLDLPIFSESQVAPASTASSSASLASRAAPEPVRTSSSVGAMSGSSTRQTLQGGSLQPGEKYRVKQGETLWKIAAKSRPGSSVTVQQTMLSIQRLNDGAFLNGNINQLKAGYVLRLPTEAEVRDISGRDAVQEVAAQNRAWRSDEPVSSSQGAQLDATSSEGSTGGGDYAEDSRLSIAASGENTGGSTGSGSSAKGGALQSQLDASQESLDVAKRENEELQDRLGDMEAKMATLQRLLELKDDQLAALQGGTAEQQAAAAELEAAAAEAEAALNELKAEAGASEGGAASLEAESTSGEMTAAEGESPVGMGEGESEGDSEADIASGESADQVSAEQSEPAAVAKEQAAPKTPAPVVEEPGFLDKALANPAYLGGAGAVALGLLALLFMRKRKAADEETEDFVLPGDIDESEEPELELEQDEALDLGGFDDEPDTAEQLAAELEQEIAADNADAAGEPEESGSVMQSETGDALAEADIYIAYGRYQQAIDLLNGAIQQEPERSDLQVKLLEVYVETRDKASFQKQFVALQALGEVSAVNQVKDTLSSVDGVADWLDDLPGVAAAEVEAVEEAAVEEEGTELLAEADDELDMGSDDLELGELDTDGLDTGEFDGELALDEDIDLDLDLDELGTTQEMEAIAEGGLDLDSDLDLDLDLEADEALTEKATAVFDAVDPEVAETAADSLGDDVEAGLDDAASAIAGTTIDSLDDLADLGESESDALSESLDEGLDANLDDSLDLDDDLDAALGEIGETELTELEAEFAAAGSETVDGLESELGSLDISEGDTVKLEGEEDFAEDFAAELDDLDLDAAPGSSTDGAADGLSLVGGDDFASEAAEEPAPASTESFDENVSAAPASDDDFDFLADTDEIATKLDLARAYIDMGDTEGARDILDEVMQEGNDEQKQEASSLMERV